MKFLTILALALSASSVSLADEVPVDLKDIQNIIESGNYGFGEECHVLRAKYFESEKDVGGAEFPDYEGSVLVIKLAKEDLSLEFKVEPFVVFLRDRIARETVSTNDRGQTVRSIEYESIVFDKPKSKIERPKNHKRAFKLVITDGEVTSLYSDYWIQYLKRIILEKDTEYQLQNAIQCN